MKKTYMIIENMKSHTYQDLTALAVYLPVPLATHAASRSVIRPVHHLVIPLAAQIAAPSVIHLVALKAVAAPSAARHATPLASHGPSAVPSVIPAAALALHEIISPGAFFRPGAVFFSRASDIF